MSLDKHAFAKCISETDLLSKHALYIVGVSGGVDSVVLCHLLKQCEFSFVIAHVNYGLRGEESEQDEKSVIEFGKTIGVEVRTLVVNMEDQMRLSGKGIQETAREIRYNWFEELLHELEADFILTAHHKSDQAETIIHQFIRGGMLKSLAGMKQKGGLIRRPLLTFSKHEILEFAESNKLHWREDRSNAQSDYTRNFIRHEVLNVLRELNPNIENSLSNRSILFREADTLLQRMLLNELKVIIRHKEEETQSIEISSFINSDHPHLLMWQWLEPLGFSSHQSMQAMELLNAISGSRIESDFAVLWRESDALVLTQNKEDSLSEISFQVTELPWRNDGKPNIDLSLVKVSDVNFAATNTLFVSADKIQFPFTIRSWKQADRFKPLGMTGTQKISDFLIQKKIPRRKKGEVFVMESNGKIVAVIGHRISEDFKLGPDSTTALRILYTPAL